MAVLPQMQSRPNLLGPQVTVWSLSQGVDSSPEPGRKPGYGSGPLLTNPEAPDLQAAALGWIRNGIQPQGKVAHLHLELWVIPTAMRVVQNCGVELARGPSHGEPFPRPTTAQDTHLPTNLHGH